MVSQRMEKAFKRRSIVGTVGIVLLAIVLVVVLAGVGVRYGSPPTWEKGMNWAREVLDGPMLNMFEKISTQYVDGAPDIDSEEKQVWKGRLRKTVAALREEKGTASRRKELRAEYEGIVEKMEDGDLTRAELVPFEKKLDHLLEQIETEEVQKKE